MFLLFSVSSVFFSRRFSTNGISAWQIPDMCHDIFDTHIKLKVIPTAGGKKTSESGSKLTKSGEPLDLFNNVRARNRAVNDYSIVVQEFFVKRVDDWLNTVGKEVLGIAHYWVRFEFAKGRGQIHTHLLAVLQKDIMNELQRQLQICKEGNQCKEAQVVANWADKRFKLTAELPPATTDAENSNK